MNSQFKAAHESENEKDHLLKQIKEDNHEIAVMEKKIMELEEQCESVRRLMKESDQQRQKEESSMAINTNIDAGGDGSGNKNEKLEELIKRDREIQGFLDEFGGRKEELESQLHGYEANISNTLELLAVHEDAVILLI